jgi:hypothetical protein
MKYQIYFDDLHVLEFTFTNMQTHFGPLLVQFNFILKCAKFTIIVMYKSKKYELCFWENYENILIILVNTKAHARCQNMQRELSLKKLYY